MKGVRDRHAPHICNNVKRDWICLAQSHIWWRWGMMLGHDYIPVPGCPCCYSACKDSKPGSEENEDMVYRPWALLLDVSCLLGPSGCWSLYRLTSSGIFIVQRWAGPWNSLWLGAKHGRPEEGSRRLNETLSRSKYKSFSVLCFLPLFPKFQQSLNYVWLSLLGLWGNEDRVCGQRWKSLRNSHGAWRMLSAPQWGENDSKKTDSWIWRQGRASMEQYGMCMQPWESQNARGGNRGTVIWTAKNDVTFFLWSHR